MHENIGTICQVIGPVVDIQFEQEYLPDLLNAIKIENGEETLTVEWMPSTPAPPSPCP